MGNNKRIKIGLLIAILALAIGFALVTTTLYIRGSIKAIPDEEDFKTKVVFKSASLSSSLYSDDEYKALSEISGENTQTIVFKTGTLRVIGETVTLNYDIKNDSSKNAKINDLSCKLYSDQAATIEATDGYVSVTPTNLLSGKIMGPKSVSTKDTVVIKLEKSFAGDEDGEGNSISKIDYEVRCDLNVSTVELANGETVDFSA